MIRTNLLALFGMLFVLSCENSTGFSTGVNPAAGYNERVEKAVEALPEEAHERRDTLIAELLKTNTYKELVTDKIVSAKYLTPLTTIGIAVSMFDKETETSSFNEKYYRATQSGLLSDDEMEFDNCNYKIGAIGGLTPAIVEVYYRYKVKFGYSGDSTKTYVNERGENQPFPVPYNLAIAFAMFEPNDQNVLEAFYESMGNSYFSWKDDSNYLPKNSDFPYLAFQKSFREHLNEVAPKSKYNILKYKSLGESVLAGSFEIVAGDWNFSKVINTGNQFLNVQASEGNTFLIIQATYKNIDQEGRTLFSAGSVFVDYHGKEYKFDKTEAILADGFGVTLEALNPLSKKTTFLIFPMSTEFKGMAFWQPAGCNERIYLGTITKKK